MFPTKKQKINENNKSKVILVRTQHGHVVVLENLPKGYTWEPVDENIIKWEVIVLVTEFMKKHQSLTGMPRNRIIEILCSHCSYWDHKKKDFPSMAMFMHAEMEEHELQQYLYNRFTEKEMIKYMLYTLVLMRQEYRLSQFAKTLRAYKKGVTTLPTYEMLVEFRSIQVRGKPKTPTEIVKIFREHCIDGEDLVRLDGEKLALMGITNQQQQLMMLSKIYEHQQLYG